MAGPRTVGTGSAGVADCRTRLETRRPAGVAPRLGLARQHGLPNPDVACGVDQFVKDQEINRDCTLEDVFERMFQ